MTPLVATALEGLGVGLFGVGLAFLMYALFGYFAAVGIALIVVGLYCALAANVYSGASANESRTFTSPGDSAERR